jgi:hypothetical protein
MRTYACSSVRIVRRHLVSEAIATHTCGRFMRRTRLHDIAVRIVVLDLLRRICCKSMCVRRANLRLPRGLEPRTRELDRVQSSQCTRSLIKGVRWSSRRSTSRRSKRGKCTIRFLGTFPSLLSTAVHRVNRKGGFLGALPKQWLWSLCRLCAVLKCVRRRILVWSTHRARNTSSGAKLTDLARLLLPYLKRRVRERILKYQVLV